MSPRLRGVAIAITVATLLGVIHALVIHGVTRAERCFASTPSVERPTGQDTIPSSGRPIGQKDPSHE